MTDRQPFRHSDDSEVAERGLVKLATEIKELARSSGPHLTDDEAVEFAFASDGIPEALHRRLDAHIESCVVCAREVSELIELKERPSMEARDSVDVAPSARGSSVPAAANYSRDSLAGAENVLPSRRWAPVWWRAGLYLRALVESPAVTFVVVLACLLPLMRYEHAGLFAVPGIAAIVAILFTPRMLSNERYADVCVGGRPGDEALWHIATEIEWLFAAVEKCYRTAGDVERRLAIIANAAHPWNRKLTDYKNLLAEQDATACLERAAASLDSFTSSRRYRLDRIEAMKCRAAAELDLSAYGLCEHVFQYVPRLHKRVLSRYVGNLRLVLRYGPHLESPREVERLSAIIRQNSRLRLHHERCVSAQRRLKRNRSLLGRLVELARSRSTSKALVLYSELLAHVASEQLAQFTSSNWTGDTRDDIYRECEAQFRFLHRKQRAHGGADLTMTLVRAMETHGAQGDSVARSNVEFVLRRLATRRHLRAAPIFVADPTAIENLELVISRLSILSALPLHAERALEANRWSVVSMFQRVATAGLFDSQDDVWIVSHGMSQMVRDGLKHGLSLVMQERVRRLKKATVSARDLAPDERLGFQETMPRLFVLQMDDRGRADAAQMEFELREQGKARAFASLSTGDLDVLTGFLEPGHRVVVLLGADAFDRDGRVLQTRGQGQLVSTITRRVRRVGAECVVVVLAQAFKFSEDSLITSDRLDGHFDKMSSYSGKEIDLVVSGDLVYARKGSPISRSLRFHAFDHRWVEAAERVTAFEKASGTVERSVPQSH